MFTKNKTFLVIRELHRTSKIFHDQISLKIIIKIKSTIISLNRFIKYKPDTHVNDLFL